MIFLLFTITLNLSSASSAVLTNSELTTVSSPAHNYGSLIEKNNINTAIESVLASQSLLAKFYEDIDLCNSCQNNLHILEFQHFLYIQAHKELQALALSIKSYILDKNEPRVAHKESLKLLDYLLSDAQLNFEASPHSARIVANSSYFNVTRIFLTQLQTNLTDTQIFDTALPYRMDSPISHALIVRNMARLLALKNPSNEMRKIKNLDQREVSEHLEYWRVLGQQILRLTEAILALNTPPPSTQIQEEAKELLQVVTKYTNHLKSLQDQLKENLNLSTDVTQDKTQTAEHLLSLLGTLKAIGESSHQYSILIDAHVILAENACDNLLKK